MHNFHRFRVHPVIPERIRCLEDLAYNLRWTWDRDTLALFKRLDGEHWADAGHNPVRLLKTLPQDRLDEAAEDEAFCAHVDRVCSRFAEYLSTPGWFSSAYPDAGDLSIAYFSMEFGLTECLPIYSGGLGVLAGDYLKAASDLGLPVVGVGLLYQKGYFQQYLSRDGWQLEEYPPNDFAGLPVRAVAARTGGQLTVSVELAGRPVTVRVWLVQVGRISLYLLDTNAPENPPEDQEVTNELYGGGPEQRIRQEIVLGIGGIRALAAQGIEPEVCHMNEGHSAFLALERIRRLVRKEGLSYAEARQAVGAGTLFTTHTPVSAGFDLFDEALMQKYFGKYVAELGLEWDDFMDRGRIEQGRSDEPFNVAVLAVRHSPRRNAVSRLHRSVTARMLKRGWSGLPEEDIPVDYVTNGAHYAGWVGPDMEVLLDRYFGPGWQEDPSDSSIWRGIDEIPDEELWRARVRQREALVAYVRNRLLEQVRRRHGAIREERAAQEALRSDALTIGFARRFATYKRATLILREVERLKSILGSEQMPVQLVFSGKAHPRDDAGKEFIREIVSFAKQEGLKHRLVFLENYDLEKARMLVRGVDVWLNNPRRPLEASGTSGMKVLVNGGLNLSVLDGWWEEGFEPGAGWAIGAGEEYADHEYQDRVEAQALFSILEDEVIPLFYERGADGLPRGWIEMMKNSMKRVAPRFGATRMAREYATRFYIPAADHQARLAADGYGKARELAEWKSRVRRDWDGVVVHVVRSQDGRMVPVGEDLEISAEVNLGSLHPEDVRVEAYYTPLNTDGGMEEGKGESVELEQAGRTDGLHMYRGRVPCPVSGLYGYAVRVLPAREGLLVPHELALVTWES